MITPIGYKILVKPSEKTVIYSSIILTTDATDLNEKLDEGTVVGVSNNITDIKVGDTVIYGTFSGSKFGNNSLLWMEPGDVIGIRRTTHDTP